MSSLSTIRAAKQIYVSCLSAERVSVYALKEKKLSKQKVRAAETVISLDGKSSDHIFDARWGESD